MDFITDLPKSEGNDTILMVIDRLTKMAHFLPCTKEMNTRQLSALFMREIFRLQGLPKDIITDWDLYLLAIYAEKRQNNWELNQD